MQPFELRGGGVLLAAPTSADVDAITEHCQDEDSQRWTTIPVPDERGHAEQFSSQVVDPGWESGRHLTWALRHPEIFSSEMSMQMALGTERPMIPQQIDPPAQTRYRRLLDPHFSRRRMEDLVPDIRRHASALIDKFVDRGECEFDREFAVPLPCTAFLSLCGERRTQERIAHTLKTGKPLRN